MRSFTHGNRNLVFKLEVYGEFMTSLPSFLLGSHLMSNLCNYFGSSDHRMKRCDTVAASYLEGFLVFAIQGEFWRGTMYIHTCHMPSRYLTGLGLW